LRNKSSASSTCGSRVALRKREPLQFEEALRLAVRWLGRRDRPGGELERKLCEKGADQAVAARVVEHLRERGWLDDAGWAERWIAAHLERGWGRHRLVGGLLGRGFSRAEAEELVARLVGRETEVREGLRVLQRRWRPPEGGNRWASASSFLRRRGFSGESLAALKKRLETEGWADLDNPEEGE
jgi:regulatory protein